jgi:hypothetical protein
MKLVPQARRLGDHDFPLAREQVENGRGVIGRDTRQLWSLLAHETRYGSGV